MLQVLSKFSTTSLTSRLVSTIFVRSNHSKSNSSSSKSSNFNHIATTTTTSKIGQNVAKKQRYLQHPEQQQQQQQTVIKYVQYPYFVNRTQMKELPVYVDIKNGRTRVLTEISRVEGDVEELCNDIRKELFYESQEKNLVRVNHTNNHVIIKGRHGFMVKEWLAKKGF